MKLNLSPEQCMDPSLIGDNKDFFTWCSFTDPIRV